MSKPASSPIQQPASGILYVLSAPSGAGKSTLCNELKAKTALVHSVSCTTRAPRPGEVNGTDYHFLTHEDFKQRIAAGEFLEYAEVHGNFYGTLCSTVLDNLRAGKDVLVVIDVQGAASIRSHAHPEIREALADVFLMPESLEILRLRLTKRGTETPEQMALRLKNAEEEMAHWPEYRYAIITGSVEEDLANFVAIMTAERALTRRRVRMGEC